MGGCERRGVQKLGVAHVLVFGNVTALGSTYTVTCVVIMISLLIFLSNV